MLLAERLLIASDQVTVLGMSNKPGKFQELAYKHPPLQESFLVAPTWGNTQDTEYSDEHLYLAMGAYGECDERWGLDGWGDGNLDAYGFPSGDGNGTGEVVETMEPVHILLLLMESLE